jgi:hypothetical protein
MTISFVGATQLTLRRFLYLLFSLREDFFDFHAADIFLILA